MDAAQNFEVMLGYLEGLGAILYIFAKIGEDAANVPLFESARGFHRNFQALSRHEARHASAHKWIINRVFAQPSVLGSGKQDRPHQRHGGSALRDGVYAPTSVAALF